MSTYIMILVLAGFFSWGISSVTQNDLLYQGTENMVDNFLQEKAANLASDAANILMMEVANDRSYRVTDPETMLDGDVTYTVTDEVLNGEDLIKFSITSNKLGASTQVVFFVEKTPIPSIFNGAITANNPVVLSLGGLIIDGRNHTPTGNLIPETGVYAIWTTGSFSQSGNSDLGGTSEKIDYIPSNPADSNIIKENQSWDGGYPETPDEIMGGSGMGFPEGTLRLIAQSGLNGSQYVTDPANLIGTLSGVTYIESNIEWVNANITGSGILIVHNSNRDAIMKNISGTFVGILIVDDLVHIHSTIIGAIVTLSPNPSDGNTLGNGSGEILYSSETILDALNITGLENLNYGFGKNRLFVKYWYE